MLFDRRMHVPHGMLAGLISCEASEHTHEWSPNMRAGTWQNMPRLPANALRPAAVRLLMGFMGAACGSLYSLQAFCADVRGCYRAGWAPQQLFDSLGPEELGQVIVIC